MKLVKKILALSILAGLTSSAFAANVTGNFQATATLNGSCVVSATNVAFGAITPAATGTSSATATITTVCSNGAVGTIAVNGGLEAAQNARKMAGTSTNTDKLAYQLYTEATHTTVLGDGTATTSTFPLLGTGVAVTNTIYGQLSLNQYLKPDTYTDNLIVTVNY